MFKLNQPVLVSDFVEALSEESGRFQITSPDGETMQIRLEDGLAIIECAQCCPERARGDRFWEIIKIEEIGYNVIR